MGERQDAEFIEVIRSVLDDYDVEQRRRERLANHPRWRRFLRRQLQRFMPPFPMP